MPYRRLDLDASRPLPAVALTEREDGLAVVVRWEGRPVAFWMEALRPGTALTPAELAERVGREAGTDVLRARLRAELPVPTFGGLPSLTIAVCTKDRPERLARCLDTILALPPLPGAPARPEVLVVDNAPGDGRTREAVQARPGVCYAVEPRPGLDFARNRAVEAASGHWLAFVDDDVALDAGWLGGWAEALRQHPDAGCVTGLVLPLELETPAQVLFEAAGGFRRGFRPLRYHGQELPGNPLYPCGAGIFGAGANMAFRRDVLQELGGFDEALDTGPPLPGGGDLDAFYRVIRAGHPLVYEPAMLVFHEHRREAAALRRQYESWGRGFMAFLARTYQTDPTQRAKVRRLVAWWFRYEAKGIAASLLRRHPLPLGMVLDELRGGVVGLFGEYGRSQRRVERIRRAVPAGRTEPRSDATPARERATA